MTSQHAKLYVVVFLTLTSAPSLLVAGRDPAQAQAQAPAQDPTVMNKLSPFDKSVVDIRAQREGLSPEEQVWQAEFLYKMKTGAPLNPEEQAFADKLTPDDKDFYQKDLSKFNDVPEDQVHVAWNKLVEEKAKQVAAGQS